MRNIYLNAHSTFEWMISFYSFLHLVQSTLAERVRERVLSANLSTINDGVFESSYTHGDHGTHGTHGTRGDNGRSTI